MQIWRTSRPARFSLREREACEASRVLFCLRVLLISILFALICYLLKVLKGDLTQAETEVYYLPFAKLLTKKEMNSRDSGAENGSTLLSRS